MKLINMGELFACDRLGDVDMERAPVPERDPERFLVEPGDLLFARQSLKLEGAGRCCIVLPSAEPRTWEGHIIRARMRSDVAVGAFYYYWFRSPEGRAAVASIVEQVAAAGIRSSDLARLEVPLPSLREQRAVADVLEALDYKIESNRRMAGVVDALLRAETARATEVECGETSPLGDLVESVRNTVKPEAIEPATRYIGLEHMPRGRVILDEWGTADGLASAKARFEPGDVLFGKLRPYFKKVGLAPWRGVCSTDILVLRPRDSRQRALLLATLASDECIDHATGGASGTRMPRASWEHMSRFEVVVPPGSELDRLASVMDPLLEMAQRTVEESATLAALRDLLLPELLSGRMRVPVAEELADA